MCPFPQPFTVFDVSPFHTVAFVAKKEAATYSSDVFLHMKTIYFQFPFPFALENKSELRRLLLP